MVEVQILEVDVLPDLLSNGLGLLSIAGFLWVTSHTIFSWCHRGNQGVYFTVWQKRHKGIDVTKETRILVYCRGKKI
jgi:hypothetical protein